MQTLGEDTPSPRSKSTTTRCYHLNQKLSRGRGCPSGTIEHPEPHGLERIDMNKIGGNLSCMLYCAVLCCCVHWRSHRLSGSAFDWAYWLSSKCRKDMPGSRLQPSVFPNFSQLCSGIISSEGAGGVLHLRLLNHDGAKSRAAMSKIVGIPKLNAAKFYA